MLSGSLLRGEEDIGLTVGLKQDALMTQLM